MSSLAAEKYYPWVAAAGAAVAGYQLGLNEAFFENRDTLLQSTLTLAAIFTGFLATANSLLISLRGSQVLGDLSSNGYLDDLLSYMTTATNASLSMCLWSLTGLFVDQPSYLADTGVYTTTWAALTGLTVSSFYRVSSLMIKLVKKASTE